MSGDIDVDALAAQTTRETGLCVTYEQATALLALVRERDEARGQVERVEALAADHESPGGDRLLAPARIREALAGRRRPQKRFPWHARDCSDRLLCRHCGKPPEADGDHSCPCPYRDDECPDHPRPTTDALAARVDAPEGREGK